MTPSFQGLRLLVATAVILGAMADSSGCYRTNPDFDLAGGSGSRGSSTADTTGAEGSTAGERTSGATGDPPLSVCEIHEDRPIVFEVWDRNGTWDPPTDPCQPWATQPGCFTVDSDETEVLHYQCPGGGCGCEEPINFITVFIQGLADLPPLEGPGRLLGHTATTAQGECVWTGLTIFAAGPTSPFPLFHAINGTEVTGFKQLNDPISAQLAPLELCDGDTACNEPPGIHGLRFGDTDPVLVGSPGIRLIPSAGGAMDPYWVINRMSSVAEDCEQRVAWTAELAG